MKPSVLIKQLQTATVEQMLEIKGIGEVLAQNVVGFANSDRATKLIEQFEKLEDEGKAPELEISNSTGGAILGVVCITGTFDIPRPQIKELLEAKGYKVVDTINKATTILLAGEAAGSKLAKATQMGIRIENNYTQL
jgi:DNA ligase (NAD+)